MSFFETGAPETGRINGFLLGTVLENNNSEKKGMLKLRLTCEGAAKNILDGVKVLAPLAGASYGVYALPEIGEQVVVGFLGGSLSRPFVLGSLYTAADAMLSDSFDDSNFVKRFKTKGGSVVEFMDESGKEAITVKTPEKLSIKLEQEGVKVTVTADENTIILDGKGGNITVKAKSGMTLEAGQAKITLADGNITLKGTEVKLDGSTLTLKGQKSELSGATVDVKSTGILNLKGSMTKIN